MRRPHTAQRQIPALDSTGDVVVEIHEDLLNRIVGRTDHRQSEVRDFVMGADVHGMETTTTDIRIDFQPSNDGVALQLVLNGNNRSHTVGYTPQAAISTLGQHRFTATKLVIHDGRLFRTERPRVDVTPSNQTVGAQTPVSGVPFLGDVASSIAFQAAESQRSQGEAIAAQKIREGVGTAFNRQVDDELKKLNRGWLDTLAPQLRQQGFDRIRITASSTDEWARYSVEMDGAIAETTVSPRSLRPTPAKDASVRRIADTRIAPSGAAPVLGRLVVREILFPQLVERLGIAGTTVKASDFAGQVTTAIEVLDVLQQHGLKIGAVPPEALAALQSLSIRFADRNAARVLFAEDEITVQVRAALALPPVIDLPLMQIDLRYRIDAAGEGGIALVPSGVLFRPVTDDAPALGPLATLMESQALAALPAIQLPRSVRVPIPGGEPLELWVDQLQARDGKLSLTVR